MKYFYFNASLWLPHPKDTIFDFFSDAWNLEKITPPWLRFRVITEKTLQMRDGAQIDYRLRIHGVPVKWHTKITVWEPTNRFVDEQVRGPYRVWIHEHRFAEQAGGTVCEDFVKYAPIGGTLINSLFVARDVREIFAYRAARLQELFNSATGMN